jgi:mRNA interferase MazF
MSDLQRGQIWWVDFGEPAGSEPGYRHPVLVLQRDQVNASRIATVVVAVLTSNVGLATAPGNVLLAKRQTHLPRDTVFNASQIITINRDELQKLIGTLSPTQMERVDDGLRWFLALDWN